jgi:hypothetical protein
MLKKELDLEALFRMDEDGDGKVTLIEFVTGALHQISGIDPEKEIHPWIQRFHELDADGNGYLDQNVRYHNDEDDNDDDDDDEDDDDEEEEEEEEEDDLSRSVIYLDVGDIKFINNSRTQLIRVLLFILSGFETDK